MSSHRTWMVGLGLLLAGVLPAAGAGPARPADNVQDAQVLAMKIDAALAEGWKAANVKPAPLADDAKIGRAHV